jgi:16S rRNA (guanine1207-N2)-methyltransferase
MERSSEVILRNEAKLPGAGLMLINPPRDSLRRRLEQSGRPVRLFTQNHGDFCWHASSSKKTVRFGLLPAPDETASTVILTLPREKDLLTMMLHALSCSLPPDSRLWLVGENKAGIKSSRQYLERFFRQVSKLDSARHCVLFEASQPSPETSFDSASYVKHWQALFACHSLDIVSLPGVFAHGRLDPGSQMLLDALEGLQPNGKILDFACGSGVIGCSLLAANRAIELTLLDVSAIALESSRRTLEMNALQAHLLPSDGLDQVEGRFDWIVSNPPFHRGVRNDLDIAANFFAATGTFLTGNGRIVIVCNRHLPYEQWLRTHFDQVERLCANDRFAVIMAAGPRNG